MGLLLTRICRVIAAALPVVSLLFGSSPADAQPPSGSWELITQHAAFSPRDTAEPLVYDGKMWLSNGWYSNTDPIKDLWNSTDGLNWTLVGTNMPYDAFSEMVVFDAKMWAIKRTVWNSTDGITWTQVLAQTPFGYRPYGEVVVFNGKMWQLGSGRDVWSSTDGVEWICATPDAGYGGRYASAVTVFNGKIWLMGGVTQDFANNPPEFWYPEVFSHSDVWCSADGVNWDRVLENAPWAPRMWSGVNVYLGRMWILGGFSNRLGYNLGDVWYSEDGTNWAQLLASPTFSPRHEPAVYVYNDHLWMVAGNEWPIANDVWRLTTPPIPPIMKALTVSKSGTGEGTVNSVPFGIDCGTTCQASFAVDTVVTLSAAEALGSVFVGWSGGGCSGIGTCDVAMTQAQDVTATFATFLVVTKVGTGLGRVISSPAGIDCGTTCMESFAPGTVVTLFAAANPGSVFAGWTGGGCSGTGTCTVAMTQTWNVTATFVPQTSLVVTKSGTGLGRVISSPVGIDCGATCQSGFTGNTVVTLFAAANSGSVFVGWTGGGCSGTGTCTVAMTQTWNVTATFAPQTLLVVTKSGTGLGKVMSIPAGIDCGATCQSGFASDSIVTLLAAANSGSVFVGWTGGGCSGSFTCDVVMTQARNVTATFAPQTFSLVVTRSGAGLGNVISSPAGIDCGATCQSSFVIGTSVTLSAVAAPDSVFVGWTGGGCSGTGTCDVAMTQTWNVTAEFMATVQGQRAYTVAPCRILDTRGPNGPFGGPPMAAGEVRAITMTGGPCSIPADAAGVAFNVTVADASAPGELTIFPGSGTVPGTSTISFVAGKTRANNVILGLVGGVMSIKNSQPSGTVNVIVDVSAYFQ